MRLLEAIIDANQRAIAGDANAGLHPSEFDAELPLVALTCIDARLNAILPQVLGIPPNQFVWLRNAGNVITGPLSSTMRSLALACAVKGGKEIAIIGHTDCLVGKTTTMELLDRLRALGVERHLLPDNLNDYFGIFGSERQNVLKATDLVRGSPLIGPKVPVHGLMVDVESGRLEWLVNGYQALESRSARWDEVAKSAGQMVDAMKPLADFKIGEMRFPETKIGEGVSQAENWLREKIQPATPPPVSPAPSTPPQPPKLPLPPPLRPRILLRKDRK